MAGRSTKPWARNPAACRPITAPGQRVVNNPPVGRVIVRDPSATTEEFIRLSRELDLSGVDATVGWSAWLELARWFD